MKKTSRSNHGTLNELNITPLLDLAFVLLVIFIITTPQLVNNLEMSLPSAESQPPSQPPPKTPPIQRISVEASGRILLNNTAVNPATLRASLASLKAADPELAVVVLGSDEVEYQGMVRVLDVLRQLEITKVGLATLEAPAEIARQPYEP